MVRERERESFVLCFVIHTRRGGARAVARQYLCVPRFVRGKRADESKRLCARQQRHRDEISAIFLYAHTHIYIYIYSGRSASKRVEGYLYFYSEIN